MSKGQGSSPKTEGSSLQEDGLKMCPSVIGIKDDTDRINALYSPFRPRAVNPESFDHKLMFWSNAMDEYVTLSHRITFTLEELKTGFRVNNKTPACLEEVINNGNKKGLVIPYNDLNDYLKSCQSWLSWSQVSVKKALAKVLPNPLSYFTQSTDEDRYIHLMRLQFHMEQLKKETTLLNKLMSFSKFNEKVQKLTNLTHPLDIEVFLSYIKAHNMIVRDKIGQEDVVLIGNSGVSPKICMVDKGKYDVNRTKEILENQLENLHEKANLAELNAKKALKDGKRNTAKHELCRRKLLEQQINKILNMVDNLTVIGIRIEEAESDATMMIAYEAGKKALAGVFKDQNLTVDRVTEAMLDIQDLLDTQAEISSLVSEQVSPVDSNELEEELEILLREEDKNKKLSERRKKEEEETLKLLSDLKVVEDESMSFPTKELHSSVASEV